MIKSLRSFLLSLLIAGALLPVSVYAARTQVDWVNLSGTSYIQPNFGLNGMDLLIVGSNHYINFNAVTGINGYGIRDNAGVIECKNSGGSWSACQSGSSGGGSGVATTSLLATFPNIVTKTVASITFSNAFSTTTDTGLTSNRFAVINAGGILGTVASSGLALPNTALQNSSFTINGVSVSLGGSGTIASTTLLGDNNTFSGLNRFTGAATTSFTGGISATYLNITGASATSTAANGIDLANGCFSISGSCLQQIISSASAYKAATTYASTTTLPANVYNNGMNGVGATLTGVGNGPFYIDGNAPGLSTRVLVKNEATGANNGIYTLTTVGVAGLTPYVLTRATDYNSNVDVFPGVANYVNSGTVNANTCWILSNVSAVTIGTTALTYTDDCGAGSFSGTYPIMVSGTTISTAFGTTTNTGLPANQFVYTSNGGILLTVASSGLALPNTALANSLINFSFTGMSGTASTALGGTETINASSSPGFGFFNASSTSATSTLNGDLAARYLNLTGTAASSTFANGVNLTKGCFSVNGACIGATGPAGSSASTTLLIDNNTFAGLTAFTNLGTTTFQGHVEIGKGMQAPSLFVGTGTIATSIVGFLPQIDGLFRSVTNDFASLGILNEGNGPCTLAALDALNKASDSASDFMEVGQTGINFTGRNGDGSACAFSNYPAFAADSGYIYNISSDINVAANRDITFYTNTGVGTVPTSSLVMAIKSTGRIFAGTSTPGNALFAIATGTLPQLSLSDGVAANNAWVMRAINNNLYFATSTATATSTKAAFSIDSNGVPSFGDAPLGISSGGTNASSIGTSNGILAYNGTSIVNFANFTLTSSLLTATNASSTNGAYSQSLFVQDGRVYGKGDKSFDVSSSTLSYRGGWPSATTSLMLWNPQKPITITDFYCKPSFGVGTTTITIGSGTASSTITCGSGVAGSATGLSIAIAARGNLYFDVGNGSGSAASFVPTFTFNSPN